MSILQILGLADGCIRFDDGTGPRCLPTAAVMDATDAADLAGVSAPVLAALRHYLEETT
jgi:hypothetical protein